MKIFLCSTSFDLEDLRALAVDRFGAKHEFIHFENAAFPSRRGLHSHDQCIEAVKQADVVVCIIDRRYGGRYGGRNRADFSDQGVRFKATVGSKEKTVETTVQTKDLSISWCELITAYREQKYIITFARRRTFDEKATRRKNQGIVNFKPAHVDDCRVFDLLDWITKQPKDNWIIPFENAVDFLTKLEKWLNVASATLVLPKAPKMRRGKPITVIVEGPSDAEVVKAVASKLLLQSQVSLVVTEGKRTLLANLSAYTHAFKDSAGIIVLADADTSDPAEIEIEKAQFRKIVAESDRPDTEVVFAMPEIEVWFGKIDKKHKHLNRFKLAGEIRELKAHLDQRAASIPSLKEFIEALKSFDDRDSED